MILLGAGSSVPFGIPDMKGFVETFRADLKDDNEPSLLSFLTEIESALGNSETLIGNKIQFDLESLMVVLQDLVAEKDKPISSPTFAFTLSLISQKEKEVGSYNIRDVRATFGERSRRLLERLQRFVFDVCMEPIKFGQKDAAGFSFLDRLYGPLFATLGGGQLSSESTKWIFTTNWDLCLKQWLEYARVGFEDGTLLDGQRKPVMSPLGGWVENNTTKVVPLHGSLDLIRRIRNVTGRTYEDIHKVTSPEVYFSGNPSEIAKAFMIYPLEAVGYEQSVKSPYLDMLNLLKNKLRSESLIFVIGFSFRDSTITSIFDEVVRERAQVGKEKELRIFLVNSSPNRVIENLTRQGYENIGPALIPIEVTFPKMRRKDSPEESAQITRQAISSILGKLHEMGVPIDTNVVNRYLERYKMSI